MAEMRLGIDLHKYPTLAMFSRSDAFVRFLIGPRGSLKTSYCFNEILRLACMQQPNADGVRATRWVVVRNTYDILKRATMASARQNIPEPLVRYTEGNSPSAKGRFSLADGTTVDLKIEFMALDTEDVLGKVLGYDFTGAMVDEISELPEEVILALARSAGRFPMKRDGGPTWHGLIGATNGPLKSHWLYRWYKGDDADFTELLNTMESQTGRKFFELFEQPPALIRPTGDQKEWLPNPLAENIDNLPGGYAYYYAMLAGSDQKITAYVEGRFSNLVSGTLVFPEFTRERNVIPHKKLPPLGSNPIIISADFGRTPAVLVGAETTDGTLVILDEVVGDNVSVDRLCDDMLVPLLKQKYTKSKIIHAWGDPAGAVSGQATEASPFSVMQSYDIPMQAATSDNTLGIRIDAVKYYLERTTDKGRPKLLVSDRCPLLIKALAENYIYEKINNTSRIVRDTPTKSHVDWVSDLADALQYMCLGMRLRGKQRKRSKDKPKKGRIV